MKKPKFKYRYALASIAAGIDPEKGPMVFQTLNIVSANDDEGAAQAGRDDIQESYPKAIIQGIRCMRI